MEGTQSFRLIGNIDVEEIPFSPIGGQNVVLWENIELLFPDVKYIKNGSTLVDTARDSNGARIVPIHIKHYPGVVLDIVVHTTVQRARMVASTSVPTNTLVDVLQNRVQAVLTQTYKLHEYPIPRLFIVLPQYPSRWHILEPFAHKYRLYFLCECGEHTKTADINNRIPHEIHLAKHEGYEIARPFEFFQKYGSYVLTILQMLKFGISVAGVAVPDLSHLVSANALDQAADSLQQLKCDIELGMDQVISYIQKISGVDGGGIGEEVKEKNAALEGADLRKLETFLKAKDGNKVLGNLYRIITDEGHIKWVCINHYRKINNKAAAKAFQRAVDEVGASFNENSGIVKVRLPSKELATHFYSALEKAKSVHELDLSWDWECTRNDVEILTKALKRSSVPILQVDLRGFQTHFGTKIHLTLAQHGALFCVTQLPNMKIVHVDLPKEFAKHIRLFSKITTHIDKLSYGIELGSISGETFGQLEEVHKTRSIRATLDLANSNIGDHGAQVLAQALRTYSTLTTFILRHNAIGDIGAQALAEALKTNSTLTTLDLKSNSIGSEGGLALAESLKTNSTLTILDLHGNSIQGEGGLALAEALKVNWTLITLDLSYNSIGDEGGLALAEALTTSPSLTSLDLQNNSLGGAGGLALAEALKTNSTLTTLNLQSNSIGSDGGLALAEALKVNSTLTTLNLQSTSIGSDGCLALAEALKVNSTLTTLDLSYNSFGENSTQMIVDALKTNITLTSLDLRSGKIREEAAQELAGVIRRNGTRTTVKLSNEE
ncbi:hypothetical protein BGZ67_008188 [Mortierella alpina]|nr:hypothetical protein BGZ67_008188 [Mortierella alpina]